MNVSEFHINDEVEFVVMGVKCQGMINFISPTGLLRINSLVGEYRRMPDEVTRICRKNTEVSKNG